MKILNRLRGLSAAEDFFRALDVDYDPRVLDVARLHILRRFGELLERHPASDVDDEATLGRCRKLLRTAYDDFVNRSPLANGEPRVLDVATVARASGLVPATALHRARRDESAIGGFSRKN